VEGKTKTDRPQGKKKGLFPGRPECKQKTPQIKKKTGPKTRGPTGSRSWAQRKTETKEKKVPNIFKKKSRHHLGERKKEARPEKCQNTKTNER